MLGAEPGEAGGEAQVFGGRFRFSHIREDIPNQGREGTAVRGGAGGGATPTRVTGGGRRAARGSGSLGCARPGQSSRAGRRIGGSGRGGRPATDTGAAGG
ncbi:hypothetical protein GCM10023235_36850 [Kitasatospora terrestris]|uniref:Uncharacterized protein n=1 Tax=Kitasatospora terrestris TaxID=258051 RepID=A0ABP9DPQ5_9ACTN